jgi:ribosomal protein S18 acetylase RimI-like enzyme
MHLLDNPVWQSLKRRHQHFAHAHDGVARYPADVAPFLAVDPARTDHLHSLAALVDPGESVLIVGPAPVVDAGWQLELLEPIAQMVCDHRIAPAPGAGFIELEAQHRTDLLELTALVYPHYFRPRTPDMGRYIGIYDGSRLAAMAGERMGFDGHQEISAVCTHPDYLGRGLAQRLVTELTNASHDAGKLPFLHVSNRNVRAKALYERLGYVQRIDINLWSLKRLPSDGDPP